MEKRTLTVGLVILGGLIVLCVGAGTVAVFFVRRTVQVNQARAQRQQGLSTAAMDVILQARLPSADEAEFKARLDASGQHLYSLLEPQDTAALRYTFDGKTFHNGPSKGVLSPEARFFEESHVPDDWNEDSSGLSVQAGPFATRTTHHVGATVDGKPCLVVLTWEITEQ
jgi:hypothetical protein